MGGAPSIDDTVDRIEGDVAYTEAEVKLYTKKAMQLRGEFDACTDPEQRPTLALELARARKQVVVKTNLLQRKRAMLDRLQQHATNADDVSVMQQFVQAMNLNPVPDMGELLEDYEDIVADVQGASEAINAHMTHGTSEADEVAQLLAVAPPAPVPVPATGGGQDDDELWKRLQQAEE